MKQRIRAVQDQRKRTGTFGDRTFSGLEFEEGWLLEVMLMPQEFRTTFWLHGSFASPQFSSVDPTSFMGQIPTEVVLKPIDLTIELMAAALGMIWEWEVWEPITVAGTCAIDSLERMLELPRETLLHWFRTTGRDPSIPEEIIQTLEDNGYVVDVAGPDGFGKFHEDRRLVSMFRKNNPQSGHVILVYEFDKDIFDAASVFKKVSDVLWSDQIGYSRGPVWKIRRAV